MQGITNTIILKLDSDGNFIWAKDFGGQGGASVTAFDIATDNSNNIYLTGTFGGIIDFDPNSGVHTLDAEQWPDVFIQKLNSNGNFQWVRHVGGEGSDTGSSIVVDEKGIPLRSEGFRKHCFRFPVWTRNTRSSRR